MTDEMVGTLALGLMGGLGLLVAGFIYSLVKRGIKKVQDMN